MFIPSLQITKADRKRLGELAQPYFGMADCSALADQAGRMLARLTPWSDVRVAHFPTGREETEIRLAVFVDYRIDHAIFLTKDVPGDA
jgi:hypothetical protein